MPKDYSISQNYPNPFNPSTIIKYQIAEKTNVSIKVYDMLGKEVATLVNEVVNAGEQTVKFDASNLSTGVYVYRIQAGSFSATKKMIFVK